MGRAILFVGPDFEPSTSGTTFWEVSPVLNDCSGAERVIWPFWADLLDMRQDGRVDEAMRVKYRAENVFDLGGTKESIMVTFERVNRQKGVID